MKIKLLLITILFSYSNFTTAQNCDPLCELWCEESQECINVCSECDKIIAADNCADATTPSYAELDGFRINSCVFTPDGPAGLPSFCGPGTIIHNNFWIGFTPSLTGRLHLNIEIITCESTDQTCNGIQAALCRALCRNPGNEFYGFEFQTLDCINCVDQTFDLITVNAIAGLPHYIMIDGCCGDFCEMIIHVIDTGLLDPEIIMNANSDLEVKVQGGETPYEVTWDNGDEGMILENPDPDIIYVASIKDARNDTRCISSDVLSSSRNALSQKSALLVNYFPNPTNSLLNLVVETDESWSYKILNLQGQLLSSGNDQSKKVQVDVSDFVSGIYLIYFEMEDGVRVEKFVVEGKGE